MQKVKTEAQIVHRRANEVLSQRQFCRAFFPEPVTPRRRPLLSIPAVPRPGGGHGRMRALQAPVLEPPPPAVQRLRLARHAGGGPRSNAWSPGVPRGTLTGGGRVIQAARDAVGGRARGAGEAVWPASGADRLLARPRIAQLREGALPSWTPVRGGDMGWHQ